MIIQSYHEESNDNKLIRKHDEYNEMKLQHIDSSTDDEKTDNEEEYKNDHRHRFEERNRRIYKKKSIKKTIVQSIHYDKKWLKLKHCFGFLKAAGYNTLLDEKTKITYEGLHAYCKQHEHEIRVLFGIEKMVWKDEIDGREKSAISTYVNTKLKTMLAINISPTYKGSTTYEIKSLFYPV